MPGSMSRLVEHSESVTDETFQSACRPRGVTRVRRTVAIALSATLPTCRIAVRSLRSSHLVQSNANRVERHSVAHGCFATMIAMQKEPALSHLAGRHELQRAQGNLEVGRVGLEVVQSTSNAGLQLRGRSPRRAVRRNLVQLRGAHSGDLMCVDGAVGGRAVVEKGEGTRNQKKNENENTTDWQVGRWHGISSQKKIG